MIDFIPVRPDISLVAILGYTLLAFAIGLVLTPWFLAFLKKNNLGKQLRVETIDGRDPAIFRKYHNDKWGTPTMGGLLIWGSIFLTIFGSRLFSFFGWVENSLLQRGQVYLPIFTLLALGTLGVVDDFINIRGVKKGLDWFPKLLFLLLIATAGALWFSLKLGYNEVHVPFYGPLWVGYWYIPIFIFILIGTANAVNVTDWNRIFIPHPITGLL